MTLALWTIARGAGELRPVSLIPPGHGEVALRAVWSGISRGTEGRVWSGDVPAGERGRMRCPFQEGSFPFPVKYGYNLVAEVTDGDLPRGTRVFCLHPHQQAAVVPVSAVVPLPADVPSERAVLAANQETALNAVWDAQVGPGDTVAVVGGGVVGMLVARLCRRLPGTEVTVVDTEPQRAATARALGLSFAEPKAAPSGGADVVFHASGSPEGLRTALGLAGDEATVVELSWFGDQQVTLPLGAAFHAGRQRILSSQVGRLPPWRRTRWSHQRRLNKAVALLADEALDVLLGASADFELAATTVPLWLRSASDGRCARLRYR